MEIPLENRAILSPSSPADCGDEFGAVWRLRLFQTKALFLFPLVFLVCFVLVCLFVVCLFCFRFGCLFALF